MTDIGDTNYKIIISIGITGSGKTNAPSGDALYILSPDCDFDFKFNQKISRWSSGRSKGSKNGIRTQGILVQRGILLNKNLNKATDLIIMEGQEANHDPLYAFVNMGDPEGDASTVYKSFRNNESTTVYHLRGYFLSAKIKARKGKLSRFPFNFTECWT